MEIKTGPGSELLGLLANKSVKDELKITDDQTKITVRDGQILKAGKLVVVKLTVA